MAWRIGMSDADEQAPGLEQRLQPRRFHNRREMAMALQARMLKFSYVYNAACLLRDSWHGSAARRERCARGLADTLAKELQGGSVDHEALLYALADSLYTSPLGVPWEP
jgi:hypothetical protein